MLSEGYVCGNRPTRKIKMYVIKFRFLALQGRLGDWTTRGYARQLADYQLADWTTRGLSDAAVSWYFNCMIRLCGHDI